MSEVPDYEELEGPGGVRVVMLAPHRQAEPMASPPVPGVEGFRLAAWMDGTVGIVPVDADEDTTRQLYGLALVARMLMEARADV